MPPVHSQGPKEQKSSSKVRMEDANAASDDRRIDEGLDRDATVKKTKFAYPTASAAPNDAAVATDSSATRNASSGDGT